MTYVFIFFLLFAINVFPQKSNVDYYPIKVGYEWTYKYPDRDWEEKFIVSDFDNTYEAFLIKIIFKMGDLLPISTNELVEKRNGKVLSLGKSGGLLNSGWEFKSSIILESNLTIGKTWSNETTGGDIEKFEVIGFSDVAVLAGEFKNVMVLQKTIISKDPKGKMKDLIYKVKEYYAPNVGKIKIEAISEKDNTSSTYIELIRYKK